VPPTPDAQRQSLDAMFRVLTAKSDGTQAPAAAAPPVAASGSADPASLFRRI
jgi:hypothetical protein